VTETLEEERSISPEPVSPASSLPPRPPAPAAEPVAAQKTAGDVPPDSLRRNPWVAAFLSGLPGLGHIYNGLYKRGITVLAAVVLFIALLDNNGSAAFGFALVFTWMFGVLDSYRQAVLINHGYSTDPWADRQRRPVASGQEKLIVGGLFFTGGFLEMLTRFGLFRWEYLFDYGYVIFMILGGALIVSALKQQQKKRELEEQNL
jgi:hypothetical protein